MQLKHLVIPALVAAANAQSSSSSAAASASASASSSGVPSASVYKIFTSVLPSSAQAYWSSHGITALFSHFASEEAAGETPAWVSKFPPALKSQFQHDIKHDESVLGLLSSSTSLPASASSSSSPFLTPATTTTSGAPSSSSTSNNLAARPTAVIGAGLIGAVGMVGLLAL